MADNDIDIDWAALIDLFASEYGWSIKDIASLDLGQILSLKAKINERYEKQNGVSGGSEGVPSGEQELTMSDFETKLGGKKRVRSDGVTEIVI